MENTKSYHVKLDDVISRHLDDMCFESGCPRNTIINRAVLFFLQYRQFLEVADSGKSIRDLEDYFDAHAFTGISWRYRKYTTSRY